MSLPSSQVSQPLFENKHNTRASYQRKPGENYMSLEMQMHLREILKKERAYWVDRQGHIISDFLQKKGGRLLSDAADVTNTAIEVRGRENRLIKKIDKALDRLEREGSRYGFCETCGAEIGIKRLEARPTANLCFDCKTLDEIHEKKNEQN